MMISELHTYSDDELREMYDSLEDAGYDHTTSDKMRFHLARDEEASWSLTTKAATAAEVVCELFHTDRARSAASANRLTEASSKPSKRVAAAARMLA